MTQPIQRRGFSVAVLSSCFLSGAARAQPVVPLEMGLLPNISARTLLTQYQPMREYLERALQRPVHLSTAPDWASFYDRVAATDYDLVVTAPHMARLAQVDHGWMPMLQLLPGVKGLLVQASARPLGAIGALRGKMLVLPNPHSLVALRGLQWLSDHGLQRGKDFSITHIPTDDSVGNVLLRGDAMAAMVSAGEFRAIPDGVRSQLQLFTEFAEVPGFMIVACPRVIAVQFRLIKSLLLEFTSASSGEGGAFLAATGFTGFREVPPAVLASMDEYLKATREMLATSS
ncbi:MAG: PhnD/SsuA/transferrin family substrate-binding protein [Betaproteobacteria bacterium]